MAIRPIPDGYRAVTPYLIVEGAASALDFYARAFGAVEQFRMDRPDGRIMHAEIVIGDSRLMLADGAPEYGVVGPKPPGGSPVGLMLYVEDVDATYARAVDAGAKPTRPVADQPYGDRLGGLEDPFGHVWWVASRIEDLTLEEIRART